MLLRHKLVPWVSEESNHFSLLTPTAQVLFPTEARPIPRPRAELLRSNWLSCAGKDVKRQDRTPELSLVYLRDSYFTGDSLSDYLIALHSSFEKLAQLSDVFRAACARTG